MSKVLNRLPKRSYRTVVDAGCGAGRQTLVLANRLGTLVHAVDSYEPFLASLMRRAKETGMERLIRAHCMDYGRYSAYLPEGRSALVGGCRLQCRLFSRAQNLALRDRSRRLCRRERAIVVIRGRSGGSAPIFPHRVSRYARYQLGIGP